MSWIDEKKQVIIQLQTIRQELGRVKSDINHDISVCMTKGTLWSPEAPPSRQRTTIVLNCRWSKSGPFLHQKRSDGLMFFMSVRADIL